MLHVSLLGQLDLCSENIMHDESLEYQWSRTRVDNSRMVLCSSSVARCTCVSRIRLQKEGLSTTSANNYKQDKHNRTHTYLWKTVRLVWLAVDIGRLLYMRCRCLCRYGRVMCLARTSAFGAGVGVHQASAANGAARLRA